MTSVQMNTRMNASLKTAGDLSIRESGSSPSEIVRAVWDYAARNRHKPKAIAALLDFLNDEQLGESGSGQLLATKGPRLIEAFCIERGIDPKSLAPTTYEDLKSATFDDDWTMFPT